MTILGIIKIINLKIKVVITLKYRLDGVIIISLINTISLFLESNVKMANIDVLEKEKIKINTKNSWFNLLEFNFSKKIE